METLSVRCNHCGAPLQVSDATRFVTCQFCQSSLEVKRTESSIFTEEVARIAENTGKMAESLEVITLQNEIERLDRENAPALAATSVREAKGAEGSIAIIGLLMVIIFGVFFAVSSSQHGAPFIFPLFGGCFVLIGLIRLFSVISKSTEGSSQDGKSSSYETRREELLKKLASYSDK
ncbi:MAG: hypothetical protein K9N47_28130 [Prosthecobacter sp.]|uniref:hypothetical protein n=1 Tax=Prosthecobacter sp. TaxID=1965333 RepID=UPI00262BBD6D|nr:hypothetical protein [Prosthecobacter sp.]MCF7790021.1 hypothetical protein [Prosthecobacter sp.]